MKTFSLFFARSLSRGIFFLVAASLLIAGSARAGLTVDVHLYHDNFGYYFYPFLSANTNLPDFPTGIYQIASPQIPTNGARLIYQATNNTISGCYNNDCGGGSYYPTFDSMLYGVTNGLWSITVTNNTSTNLYFFPVEVTGLTSNIFGPAPQAVYPTSGQTMVPNQPLMQWTGPANWAGTLYVQDNFVDTNGNGNYVTGQYLSPDATTWTPETVLPDGTNQFSVDYQSNATALVTASQPTNTSGQPISGWVSTATLETHFVYGNDYDVSFTVGQSPAFGVGGHTNVAYYSFEDDSLFAHDFSGNGNNINSYGNYSMSPYITNDAAAGSYAFGAAGDGWLYPPTNVLAALAGSFSVSLWIKTSEVHGNDNDSIYSAAGIISALNGGQNDVVPMGLTGNKLAFYTGGGSQDTLYSLTSINTGQYVQVVVTRSQQTGEKKIYVNGVLDASDFGSTDFLSDPNQLDIGYNNGQTFTGELDDIQFYSGVLSSNEVLQLYNNPGTTVPNVAGSADNGLVAHYDFDENNAVAPDVSGNGNNIVYAGNFGGSGPSISPTAKAGVGSISFDGGSYLTPTNQLLSTLAGSFSISLWVNTMQSYGYQGDYAYNGAGIISADIPGTANDLVPVALTGGQVAFNTGNTQYNYDDTINSSATVNDGLWHHVVVSRNQATGEKDIYIDGVLDTSDTDTTNLLNDPQLLTIGAIADASNPDPTSPDSSGYNGYQGLLDDIQIYDTVLTPDEVTFLYNNPGATLGSTTNTPYPVDATLQFYFIRSQDPNYGEIYGASVSFDSVSPAPTTTNSVHSPNDYFSTEQYPGGGSGSGAILSSLDQVINEFTNGLWTMYINQGSPTQQVYTFRASITGLNTNVLQAVKVFLPTNGAVNIATHPAFYWAGPSNFSTLQVDLLSGPVASLPITATNWLSAPTLNYGPDRFDVDYNSNGFAGVTFTTPVDNFSNPVRTWATTVNLSSEAFDNFVVGPNPIRLINVQRASTNFQFSFLSQTGVTNSVQYRTNLVLGSWLTYSNVTGDGTLKTIPVPLSLFSPSKQGFMRISAQ